MIAALIAAAEAAEAACAPGQKLHVMVEADGLAVLSRIETDFLGWNRKFSISWDEFDLAPERLVEMVQYEAKQLIGRRAMVPVIKVAPAGAKPVVRALDRTEWGIVAMAALAIAVTFPIFLMGNWS